MNTNIQNSWGFDSSIPVADINDFLSSDKKRNHQFVESLRSAMTGVGFVAIINTEIAQEKLNKVYGVAKQFFSQDQFIKEKLKSKTNSGERGYVNFESPKEGGIKKLDTKEFLHIGREMSEKEQQELGYPANIWPEEGNLKEPMMDLYQSLERYIAPIGKAISLAIDEDENFIHGMMENGDHLLRVIHYPGSLPKTENWAAEHTDLNFFTMLPPATSEGLEVKTREGNWVKVKVPLNAIIVNVGDSFKIRPMGFLEALSIALFLIL